MRNWHQNLIMLDQALTLINNNGIALNRIVVYVLDGGIIGVEEISPLLLLGLEYKATNLGLLGVVGGRQKASLITNDGLGNIKSKLSSTDSYLTTVDAHATSSAGIILGNEKDAMNVLLPIKGIAKDAELISSQSGGESVDELLYSISNKINDYIKGSEIISPGAGLASNFAFDPSNSYIPVNKVANVINASIKFSLDSNPQKKLKIAADVMKVYGNDGRGTLLIAAAGNTAGSDTDDVQGFSKSDYPIIVSASTLDATTGNEISAFYTSYGDRVDLCAPSNDFSKIGLYTTTLKYCGDIGTDDELAPTKTIVTQTALDSLVLGDVDFLFPGNCVELGEPNTDHHEVLVIANVDTSTKTITFTSNRIKTAPPYNLHTIAATPSHPLIECIRIPILKTTAKIDLTPPVTTWNRLKVDSNLGFGYAGQKVSIYDSAAPAGFQYFNTSILNVLAPDLFELSSVIPASMHTTGLVAVPGGVVVETSNYTVSPSGTDFFFPSTVPQDMFKAFFRQCRVEVYDKTDNKVLGTHQVGVVRPNTRQITVNYPFTIPAGHDVSVRRIGYGSYTSSFGGTSAASPVVSGVAALLLQVNNNLNALEVKHILKFTADKITGAANYSHVNNQSKYNYGYDINNKFGTGRVNALNAVQLALDWHNTVNPTATVFKPRLHVADKVVGTTLDGVAVGDPVISPDIWIKRSNDNSTTEPTDAAPINTLNTSQNQTIYVKVRNTGNKESFKGADLRIFIAFTDDPTPAFPFPDKWYDQTDVKLIGVKKLPVIGANSYEIIDFNWNKRDIMALWNSSNIPDPVSRKRKRAHILVHITPFDDLFTMDAGGANLSFQNIRFNKQLSCKPIIATHNNVVDGAVTLSGDNFNMTVGSAIVSKNFDLAIENTALAEFDSLKIKATKKRTDENNNIVEDIVFFSKTGPEAPGNPGVPTWIIEGTTGTSVSWIEFTPPVLDPSIYIDHTDAKFSHTLNVNNDEDEVKIEVVV